MHISATFNNVLITITDLHGNTLAWGTAGKAGFKGSKKSTPFAATVAGENCAREAINLGLRKVHVRVQGPGQRARIGHPGAGIGRAQGRVDPRRDADSAQRLSSSQEAAGVTHGTLHWSRLPALPPRRHQAVPQGHALPDREVRRRAARSIRRASTARAPAARARRRSTPSSCARSRRSSGCTA